MIVVRPINFQLNKFFNIANNKTDESTIINTVRYHNEVFEASKAFEICRTFLARLIKALAVTAN